ncbi:MAG: HEPN domain-containing protein [bacterium]
MGETRRPRPTTVPTREISPAQAGNYLRKAESHLASAIEALAGERWDTAALLSVHAAISASDAVCVARAGVRSISQTHMDQVRLIQQLFSNDDEAKKVSNQLAALLDRKNTVEYEARLSRREEAEIAVKQAERIVNWARVIRKK